MIIFFFLQVLTDNAGDQFLFQHSTISNSVFVVMQRVVQVGNGPVMEFVQDANMIQKRFQGFGNWRQLQESMNDYVKDWNES